MPRCVQQNTHSMIQQSEQADSAEMPPKRMLRAAIIDRLEKGGALPLSRASPPRQSPHTAPSVLGRSLVDALFIQEFFLSFLQVFIQRELPQQFLQLLRRLLRFVLFQRQLFRQHFQEQQLLR